MNKELELFKNNILKSKHKKVHSFHKFVDFAGESFVSCKKNPHIKNVFDFVFSGRQYNLKQSKQNIVRKCNVAQALIKQNKSAIINNISNKISNKYCILTHGNTAFLIDAFKKAKFENKKFDVFITDSPFSELGIFFSKNLRKSGIQHFFVPIAGIKPILKKIDFFIFSAEAVSPDALIGELGVELIAELAHSKGLPVYAVSSSWNVHNKIEVEDLKHISSQKLKGTHSFSGHYFEKITPSFVSGIISEKGVHSHPVFIDIVNRERKNY